MGQIFNFSWVLNISSEIPGQHLPTSLQITFENSPKMDLREAIA